MYTHRMLKIIDQEIAEYKKLKAELKEQKKHIDELAAVLALQIPEDEKQYASSILYWLYKGWVSVTSIGDAIGVKPHSVCNYVDRGSIPGNCTSCGKGMSYTISSRTHIPVGDQSSRWRWVCSECEEKISERWTQESSQRQQQRESELERLRGLPYREYLQTDHWKETRTRALKRARFSCQLCNVKDTTLHTHHRTYDNLGQEQNTDLIVLCGPCHSKFHDK